MKRRNLILAALALTLVVTARTGSAWAYFTTYAEAQGGRVIELGDRTELEEEFSNWEKRLTITADEGSEPVYVRATAFGPAAYPLSYSGSGWTAGPDGWYYYESALADGASAEELTVRINDVPSGELLEDGDAFNVVVVYESVPVQYGEDGRVLGPTEVDWSRQVEENTLEGGAEG